MLIQLNLNYKEASAVRVNKKGEFMMNTNTGFPTNLAFGIARELRASANSKLPLYITGRVIPPAIKGKGNPPVKNNRLKVTHYSVTVVRDDIRLITASNGIFTTYYLKSLGGFRDFRINEGVNSVEEAHEALVRHLLTTDRAFSYMFWGVAGSFISSYLAANPNVKIFSDRVKLDGEDKFSTVEFKGYDSEEMEVSFSLNGEEHTSDILVHPLLSLKDIKVVHEYVDSAFKLLAGEQDTVEEVEEVVNSTTTEEDDAEATVGTLEEEVEETLPDTPVEDEESSNELTEVSESVSVEEVEEDVPNTEVEETVEVPGTEYTSVDGCSDLTVDITKHEAEAVSSIDEEQ